VKHLSLRTNASDITDLRPKNADVNAEVVVTEYFLLVSAGSSLERYLKQVQRELKTTHLRKGGIACV